MNDPEMIKARQQHLSLAQMMLDLSVEEKRELLDGLTDDERAILTEHWHFWARPDQIFSKFREPIIIATPGRGWGKTKSLAGYANDMANANGQGFRMHIIAPTNSDVRDVVILGDSGIIKSAPSWNKPHYYPTKRMIEWPSGAIALSFSAEEPDRLRGPQCFPAATRISMADGTTKPISDVMVGDLVMTRRGARRIAASWMSHPSASLWRMRFVGGRTLTATSDHRIYDATSGEWRRLNDFGPGDRVCALRTLHQDDLIYPISLAENCSNGAALRGGEGETGTTWTTIAGSFTGPSMSASTDQYQKSGTSTTSTATKRTTTSAIFGRSLRLSMLEKRTRAGRRRSARSSCWQSGLRSGGATSRQQSVCAHSVEGVSSLAQSSLECIARKHALKNGEGMGNFLLASASAIAVERPTTPGSSINGSAQKPATARLITTRRWLQSPRGKYSARAAASPSKPNEATQSSAVGPALSERTAPLSCEAVERLGITAPVYDLTVEGEHEFFADGILVHNCHAVLADEICAWDNLQETYDMAMMGLRLGDNPQIVITSTPKPIRWLREMAKRHAGGDPTIRWINGSTKDNSANLAKTFITQIITRYEGTRLGLQELEGKLLTESDNALWTRDLIDRHRVDIKDAPKIKDYKRIVVSVDPAVTAGDRADHVGIMVAGQRADDDTVDIMRDLSEKLKTHEWAMRAVSAYHAYYADAIVAEVNNGGDMVEHVIRSMPGGENIPIRKVFATKGKYIRAEPVAMLYEQNRVRHIGMLEHLETEMVTFETLGGAKSPDRLDAMVWAVTDLLLTSKPWKFR